MVLVEPGSEISDKPSGQLYCSAPQKSDTGHQPLPIKGKPKIYETRKFDAKPHSSAKPDLNKWGNNLTSSTLKKEKRFMFYYRISNVLNYWAPPLLWLRLLQNQSLGHLLSAHFSKIPEVQTSKHTWPQRF